MVKRKAVGSLADKIKNETPKLPMQQVLPVKHQPTSGGEEEARFNNWIPKELKITTKFLKETTVQWSVRCYSIYWFHWQEVYPDSNNDMIKRKRMIALLYKRKTGVLV